MLRRRVFMRSLTTISDVTLVVQTMEPRVPFSTMARAACLIDTAAPRTLTAIVR
ncbi:hypothetical protein AXX17_AT2G44890 [Arabidopsis thaliana]|uniref:Uncharacterized protein n=1 Tax=Arabidopsis thaliana TaxID=3702 RepID=A0A178VNH1_ARATH|nr:hypothetical protein AXX17_AT2G44890 [Arabidopsis thaliana]